MRIGDCVEYKDWPSAKNLVDTEFKFTLQTLQLHTHHLSYWLENSFQKMNGLHGGSLQWGQIAKTR